jgi:hypothetical protein
VPTRLTQRSKHVWPHFSVAALVFLKPILPHLKDERYALHFPFLSIVSSLPSIGAHRREM